MRGVSRIRGCNLDPQSSMGNNADTARSRLLNSSFHGEGQFYYFYYLVSISLLACRHAPPSFGYPFIAGERRVQLFILYMVKILLSLQIFVTRE